MSHPKPQTIEQELLLATGLKKARTESKPEYLKRLVKSIADLPDAGWEALSEEAKAWNNSNVGPDQKVIADPVDFPGAAEEETTVTAKTKEKPVVAAKPAAARPKAAVKKAAKKAAAPKAAVAKKANGNARVTAATAKLTPTPVAKKAVRKGRSGAGKSNNGDSLDAVRKEVIKNPKLSKVAIHQRLLPKYPKLLIGTVGTTRAGTRRTLQLLYGETMQAPKAGAAA